MHSPKALYSKLAAAEMVTWALLLLGLVLKYGTKTTDVATSIFGGIHGFVFLSYVVTTVLVWINQSWSLGRGIAGLLSSIVPFMTYPFEKNSDKAGLLDGPWRFDNADEKPRGVPEVLLATVIRRPWASAFFIVVLLTVVFTLLLLAGPPTQWFSK